MPKVFYLPAFLLSLSFLKALLAVSHWMNVLVLPKETIFWFSVAISPLVVLGAAYSFLLYHMAKDGSAHLVFRSSLFTIIGLVLMFLWMLSYLFFPNLYPNNLAKGEDLGIILYLAVAIFAVPTVTLYSIFALKLPTKLAGDTSRIRPITISIIHGGFWGLLLFVFCFEIYRPTYAMFTGDYGLIVYKIRNLASIELGISVVLFIASMISWFLANKMRHQG
jgi:hypothetical protein